VFPIVLSTLFFFAFGDLSKADSFNKISLAVVERDGFEKDSPLYRALIPISDIDGEASEKDLFTIAVVTEEEGEKLLKDGDIAGYVHFGDRLELVLSDNGWGQTVTKRFFDDFLQTAATVENILKENPGAIREGLLEDVYNRETYLYEASVTRGTSADSSIICYYALLAMTCLMGSTVSVEDIIKLQANMSPRAARLNASPAPKFKMFLYNICATAIFQIAVVAIVLVYITLVLGVNFGGRLPYVALTLLLGCITGLFFGTAISVITKSNGVKYALVVGGTILSSFLAGMMMVSVKHIVRQHLPFLEYVSPASLITDAFYSLYYYDGLTRYFGNMAVLFVLTVFLCAFTCLVLRRKSYASL
jgi:ABC-2 type transport system permease protein